MGGPTRIQTGNIGPVTSTPFRPALNAPVIAQPRPMELAPPTISTKVVPPPSPPVTISRPIVEAPVIMEPPKIMKNVAVERAPIVVPPPVVYEEVVPVVRPVMIVEEPIAERPVEIKQIQIEPSETLEMPIELP